MKSSFKLSDPVLFQGYHLMSTTRGTVITCELGKDRGGHGKISPTFYLPSFARVLKKHGLVHHETYGTDVVDQLRSLRVSKGKTVVVLIYNETDLATSAEYLLRAQDLEQQAAERFGAENVIHPTRVGSKIGDKTTANHWLSSAGITMPHLITDATASVRTFSNLRRGSHVPVQLVEPGGLLDTSRYNTKFVDTVQKYQGQYFYISLRAMCVGRRCVAVYIRARPTGSSPSVHAVDTPLDPALINHFYAASVSSQVSTLEKLSKKLGDVLGLGFYAHDILPDARTGKLYLCETGYKFDDFSLRKRLSHLRDQIAFGDSVFEPFVEASAKAFLEEARDLGLLPE